MVPLEQKLLMLLSGNDVTFFIPPYQRNYEWSDEQCDVFFDDVIKTYEEGLTGKPSGHFFGSITYVQSDDSVWGQPAQLVLIDGQQRITTTMLFLLAMRDISDDPNLIDTINSKYLKNDNAKGDIEYKIKLKQVKTDWEVYKDLVIGTELSLEEKNTSLFHNYQRFKNRLKVCKNKGYPLIDLIKYGLDHFSVVTIELKPKEKPWENPQEIFESMNSLGKPLSLADLVRNYLLLGQPITRQEYLYDKYWLKIEKTIPHQISNFIRDFMQLKENKSFLKATESNYKTLYAYFKKIFKDMDAEVILSMMSEYSTIYSWLLCLGDSGNTKVNKILGDLKRVRTTTAYSFLMALLHQWKSGKFSDKDIVEILDALRIYIFRRRIIGLTQAENKAFPGLVRKIDQLISARDKKLEMFIILANQENRMRLPNDSELERYLETANFYNFQYCKFYLALMEEKITRSRPDLEDENLQIEHIMPQVLSKQWEKDLGENYEQIHGDLVNTIGNLTLIRHNQILGQKPFGEKKKVYLENTNLQIAKNWITDNDRWGEDEIRNRGRNMISYLVKDVLPIPNEMRYANNFSQKTSNDFSFDKLDLIGKEIDFIADPEITATVIDAHFVNFENKKWYLSTLTREIQTRRNLVSKSGAYQGSQYWEYDGHKLADLMDELD